METFQLAERTLAAYMVNGDCAKPESGQVVCGELQQREAEARLFRCCQSTSVETVTELTEFAKAVPGFQDLDLNDQVGFLFSQEAFFCMYNNHNGDDDGLDFYRTFTGILLIQM